MIHIFIGTKAQMIKIAPIVQELDRRRMPYRFINAGQHGASIAPLIKEFGLRDPDVTLHHSTQNISTLGEGLRWLSGLMGMAIVNPSRVRREVFGGHGGLCLIHGDTATALASLFLAKRAGVAVCHVEAGLRSFNLLDPFPEELIRLIAMRFADLLVAPDDWAADNLARMRVRGQVVRSHGNTVADSLAYAQSQHKRVKRGRYAVMSIHRFETIQSKERLTNVIALAERIGSERPVKFIVHGPTLNFLKRHGLLNRLERAKGVETMPLVNYIEFVAMLSGADFIVIDGGSIQEESAILGVPCLVLRRRTERHDGLGKNAVLSEMNEKTISGFLANFDQHRCPPNTPPKGEGPSARIVSKSLRWLEEKGSS